MQIYGEKDTEIGRVKSQDYKKICLCSYIFPGAKIIVANILNGNTLFLSHFPMAFMYIICHNASLMTFY